MTLASVLVIFFGLTASGLFIISNYVIQRKWIILLQGIGILSVSIMFAIRATDEQVQAFWGVALLNMLILCRNVYLYFRENYLHSKGLPSEKENIKTGVVFGFLVVSIYFTVTPLPETPVSLLALALFALPLGAFLTNVLAVAQNNIVALKWFILASVSCWVAFDILVGAWPTLIGDGFSAIATILSLWRLRSVKQV